MLFILVYRKYNSIFQKIIVSVLSLSQGLTLLLTSVF
jgi:hypothetical protein